MQVEDELEYYRNKAIHQDILIFEMRALLQSGKGFGNILNLKELLSNFMAVVQEKYGAISMVQSTALYCCETILNPGVISTV